MTRHAWPFFAILVAVSAYGALGIDLYLPALPAIAEYYGASAAEAQNTLVVFYIGFAFSQFFYGPIADRMGRKGPLLFGVVLFAVSNICAALAPSMEMLTVARFFQAVGACAGTVIARAIVRDLYKDKEAAHVFSLMMTAFMVVPMAAPSVGGYLLLFSGWQSLFWFMTAVSVIAAGLVLFVLPETLPSERRSTAPWSRTLHEYADILFDKRFFGYALSTGISSGTLFSYIAGSPHLIVNVFGLSPQIFALIFGINAFGIMACGYLCRILFRRFGVTRVLHYAYAVHVLLCVLLLAAAIHGAMLPILVTLFFVVASWGTLAPANVALAMEHQGARAGLASALFGTMQFVFASLIALCLAMVQDETAVPLAGVIALAGLGGFLTNRLATWQNRAA